jgi:FkbM family methyltransferase
MLGVHPSPLRTARRWLNAGLSRIGSLKAASQRDDLATEEILGRVLERGSSCIDVGANQGHLLRHMLRIAPDGRHWAIEPLPDAAALLRAEFPGVTVVEAALSDAAGSSRFHHVVNDPAYSGLKRRRYDRPDPDVRMITVRTERLDDIVPAEQEIRLIKIDVEGGELGVMRGALRILGQHRPYVIFEHGLGGADYYGTSPEMIFDLLSRCGLSISLLHGWLSGTRPFDRSGFTDSFQRGRYWMYLAHR